MKLKAIDYTCRLDSLHRGTPVECYYPVLEDGKIVVLMHLAPSSMCRSVNELATLVCPFLVG